MACVFDLLEINELLALVEKRIIDAEADSASSSHSNMAAFEEEIELLMEIQAKLEAAQAGAPGPVAAPGSAVANAVAAANMGSNFFPVSGGIRRRRGHGRRTRKGRKGSRKGRKGTRRA
jgi:hypothetical protein